MRFAAALAAIAMLAAGCSDDDGPGDGSVSGTVAPVEDAFPEIARPSELLHPCARQNSGSTLIDGLWDGDVFPELTLLQPLVVDPEAGSGPSAASRLFAERLPGGAEWSFEVEDTEGELELVLAEESGLGVSAIIVVEDTDEGWAVLGVAFGEMTLEGVVLGDGSLRGRVGARSDLDVDVGLSVTAADDPFVTASGVVDTGIFELPTSRDRVVLSATALVGGTPVGFTEIVVTPRPPCHFVAVVGAPSTSAATVRAAVREAGLGGVALVDRSVADAVAVRFAPALADRSDESVVAVGAVVGDDALMATSDRLDANSAVRAHHHLDLDGALPVPVAPAEWMIERTVELAPDGAVPAPTLCVVTPDFAPARSFDFRPVGQLVPAESVSAAMQRLGEQSQVVPSLGSSLVRFQVGPADSDAPVGAVVWVADGSFGEYRTSVVRIERFDAGWAATEWQTAAC